MLRIFKIWVSILVSGSALAQGTILNTGQGQSFSTRQVRADFGAASQPYLAVDLGFATDEVFSPGSLFDSFTVTLSSLSGDPAAIVLTADAFGFVWAPPNSQGFPLRSEDISRTAIDFPNVGRAYRSMEAYRILLPIPSEFTGTGVDVTFDFIDNLDSVNSLAFFTNPTIVPEPRGVALLIFGATLAALRRRLKK